MVEYDLNVVLKDCEKAALTGYQIAFSESKRLNRTLSKAENMIDEVLTDFNNSSCIISEQIDLLSRQLLEIKSSLNGLSFAFEEDLQNLKHNLSKFSITLFGRTMAGKSTLMEILTQGNGSSIGTGAQRTTRDIRKYNWNGLEITDVPGIGAFEGEDDEQIAFEAAKTADLILFLVTDDAPQATEADCFGRILSLGKPVICIINVKASVSENKSIRLLERDINKKFNPERLEAIKNQFLAYSKQLGQDWGCVPFVSVHLKSAFIAQHTSNLQYAETLNKVSRIDTLTYTIIKQVQEKGNFYRVKTFIDIVSNRILSSMDYLIRQSLQNESQAKKIFGKKEKLNAWGEQFSKSGSKRITSLIKRIKSNLYGEIAAFAEEHYDDKNADKAWKKLLEDRKIQEECKSLLLELEEICNDTIKEISREIQQELEFSSSFTNDQSLRMPKIINIKKIWNWSVITGEGVLAIGGIIAGILESTLAGPLGWGMAVLSVIGLIGSSFLKDEEEMIHEARIRLENNLIKSVDKVCNSLEEQMKKQFNTLIEKRVKTVIKELDRVHSVVYVLADTQKTLAWKLDSNVLELNSQLVTEAIKLIGAEGLQYHVLEVARIPGNSLIFVLNNGTIFPEEQKSQLLNMMSEKIRFIYTTENKKVLISRILGRTIDRRKIQIEEQAGIAHVPIKKAPPYLINRVKMAQQLARVAITE